MIVDYAKALAFHNGLDPRVVDELPWRTIQAYLAIHRTLAAREAVAPPQQ